MIRLRSNISSLRKPRISWIKSRWTFVKSSTIRTIHLKDFNQPTDKLRESLKFLKQPTKRPKFEKPINNVDDLINSRSYDIETIEEMINNNGSQPIIGSIVYYGRLGIVLKESQSRFNGSSIIVLNDLNAIEEVKINQVMHFHGVIDLEWIVNLKLLDSLKDDYSRIIVVDLLREFYHQGENLKNKVGSIIDILYAQGNSTISLSKVLEELEFKNYFHQSIALLSCHLYILDRPEKFIIITQDQHSSLVPPSKGYISLPSKLSQYVTEFLNSPKIDIGAIRVDNEPGFFSIKHPDLRPVLETMKLSIIYPHPKLLDRLGMDQISVWETLRKWGVYNDETDIYASVLFEPKISNKVSVVNASEVRAINHFSKCTRDHFPHLRSKFTADRIYAFEYGSTTIGVSLTKRNSRNYTINIHIPDLISKFSPSNPVFHEMINNDVKMLSIDTKKKVKLFSENFLQQFKFKSDLKEGKITQVSELFKPNESLKFNTACLTISFDYNTFESNPFTKIDKDGEPLNTKIKLNNISSQQIKLIDKDFLGKAINGKPKISLPIHLFKSQVEDELDNDDYYILGFLYEFLVTHSKHRNVNGAANYYSSNALSDIKEGSDQELEIGSKINIWAEKSDFFLRELDLFVSNVITKYADDNNIPLIKQYQTLSPSSFDPANDEVLVYHNNKLLPYYHATSYFQTLLSRDEKGNISLSAKTIGNKYLTPPLFTINNERDFPTGLHRGYGEVLKVFDSMWSILNQFQLVSFLHLNFVNYRKMQLTNDFIDKYTYLKGKGYNINGPLKPNLLSKYIAPLSHASMIRTWMAKRSHRYAVLKNWENRLQCNQPMDFECVITNIGQDFGRGKLVEVVVNHWDIDVELLSWDKNLHVGKVIRSHEILILNAISGVCILNESLIDM